MRRPRLAARERAASTGIIARARATTSSALGPFAGTLSNVRTFR
jgi:hypothetical protein